MAKGLFTQGMCVLLKQPLSIKEIEQRLGGFKLVSRQESDDAEAPETLVYEFRPDCGGHLLVTPTDAIWPDDMGDPDESPERFVAWSLGQYGPLAFPGGLERAAAQSWGWDGAADAVREHAAHVRLLISYVLGADEEDDDDLPLVPDDYDSMAELQALTRAATAILESSAALCYFNPGGEILRDATLLRQGLNHAWSHELPPLDMWTNVRIFTEDDGWVVMDTVGNGQFDLPDMEAVCRADAYKPGDIENFLRHATLYLLAGDDDVCTGDTADGPGDINWTAIECGTSLSDPPRPTIRWIPDDASSPPEYLLDPGDDELDDELDDLLDNDDDDGEDFLEDHEVRGGSIDDFLDDWEDGEDPPGSVPF